MGHMHTQRCKQFEDTFVEMHDQRKQPEGYKIVIKVRFVSLFMYDVNLHLYSLGFRMEVHLYLAQFGGNIA